MKKVLAVTVTVVIVLALTGCAGNTLLAQQQNKDSYCLRQVDAAYSTLLQSKSAKGQSKIDLERQAFNILKQAETVKCTSAYPFLYLHYEYGIGTKRSTKDAQYYRKLVSYFLNTDTEGRFEYQGTNIPNGEDKK